MNQTDIPDIAESRLTLWMQRHHTLLAVLLSLLLNLVVFLGEGLRYDELSCMGHPIVQTPNMDRIAREGMTFRNAFTTNALCLPSRARASR